jgi:hypothetical protein
MLRVEIQDLRQAGFDLELTGFSLDEIDAFELDGSAAGGGGGKSSAGSLADRFGVPPFSVLRAAEGWWQDRKRAWLALGIQSELGRGEGDFHAALGGSPMVSGYDKDGKRLVGLKALKEAANG